MKIKHFISLGQNCSGATHYVKTGLVNSRTEGRKTGPFDLCLSTYSGLCKAIEDDFKKFLDVDVVSNPKQNLPGGVLFYSAYAKKPYGDLIMNIHYGFVFNHESPGHPTLPYEEKWLEGKNHFLNNNFANFKTRYKARIKTFYNVINDAIENNSPVSFTIAMKSNTKPVKLSQTIKKKFPKLQFKIFTRSYDPHLETTMSAAEEFFSKFNENSGVVIEDGRENAKSTEDEHIEFGWHNKDKFQHTIL